MYPPHATNAAIASIHRPFNARKVPAPARVVDGNVPSTILLTSASVAPMYTSNTLNEALVERSVPVAADDATPHVAGVVALMKATATSAKKLDVRLTGIVDATSPNAEADKDPL